MKKLLITILLLLGIGHSQSFDAEFGMQADESGVVPFVFVQYYQPLADVGVASLFVNPSVELELGSVTEYTVGTEFLVDMPALSVSTRAKYVSESESFTVRLGVLLGF